MAEGGLDQFLVDLGTTDAKKKITVGQVGGPAGINKIILGFFHSVIISFCPFDAALTRETVPSLTSDMGKNTVSVLAHLFLLPQRAKSGYILSIPPLSYSRS